MMLPSGGHKLVSRIFEFVEELFCVFAGNFVIIILYDCSFVRL